MAIIAEIPRKQLERRRAQLYAQRDQWMSRWQAISEHCCPYRGIFDASEPNRGTRRDKKILNSTAVRAHRIMAAGMHSGLTSPARPWFRLGTRDKALAQRYDVRRWLDEVQRRMYAVYQASNFYNTLHAIYAELGGFGTGAMLMLEDYHDIIRCRDFTAGEYALGTGPDRRVNALYRTVWMTALQMVEEFGQDAVSDRVRRLAETKPEEWVYFYHTIEPNDGRIDLPGTAGRAYRDIYWEPVVGPAEQDRFLRVSGWYERPFMAPRWDVAGADVYGHGPGDVAIGDAKMLMRQEEDKLAGLDRVVNPPLAVPADRRAEDVNVLPGGVTFYNEAAQTRPGPLYQVALPLQELQAAINATEEDINQAFFVDMFIMLAMSDRRQITAREVAERHEEKLLMLGPVLDRLQNELLDPAIERCFSIMSRLTLAGGEPLIPPPPASLEGEEIQVEYVSILAQAQKMVGATSIEQFAGFVGNLAGVKPNVLDKIDFDEIVDQYGDVLGVPAAIIVPDEEVAKVRAVRAREETAAKATQAAAMAAEGAKTLSQAKTDENNVLTALLGGMAGR